MTLTQEDIDFFETRVVRPDTPCWNWRGAIDTHGYGVLRLAGRTQKAHRVAHEMFVGRIPEGLEVHHRCCNRSCVNPAHLEAVTHVENVRASRRLKNHCVNGHPFNEENTAIDDRGWRRCRACDREKALAKRQASPSYGELERTCKKGHLRTPENTYATPQGTKRCAVCMKEQRDARRKPGGYKDPARERATHCVHGHGFTEKNTYWFTRDGREYRGCRECGRLAARRRRGLSD